MAHKTLKSPLSENRQKADDLPSLEEFSGTLKTPTAFDIRGHVPYLISRAEAAMREIFSVEEFKVSTPMWRTLATLYGRGPLRFGTLATLTSIEPPTLHRMVRALVGRKLIVRTKSDVDGRGILLDLTAAGRQLTRKIIPRARAVEKSALNGLSRAEANDLRNILKRVCANVSPLKVFEDDR
jgi:DNA-binding MarR family transcriptional regulator